MSSAATVLIVSYDFPPSIEVGARAVAQIGRHLPRYGWQPVVLCGKESHLRQVDPSTALDFPGPVARAGEIPNPLSLYLSLRRNLPRKGAGSSRRESARSSPSRAMRTWMQSLLLTPDVHAGWAPVAVTRGLRLVREQKVDHIFSTAPWWTNHVVGCILARVTALPWTAQFRDPWTQVPSWKPQSAASSWLDRKLETRIINRATTICCVTERHSELLRRTFSGRSPSDFVTIPNGFDADEWDALDREPVALADRFTLTYTGDLWQQRSPVPVFRAIGELIESRVVARDRVRIELIGACDETSDGRSVKDIAAEHGIAECVDIIPRLTRPQALDHMRRSHLLLVLAEGWTLQIPQKTYEYMRSGRPVLALSSDGALRDLLGNANGAWVVDPGDAVGIRSVIEELHRQWARGTPATGVDRAFVARFDRRLLAGEFARVFATRCGPPSRIEEGWRGT